MFLQLRNDVLVFVSCVESLILQTTGHLYSGQILNTTLFTIERIFRLSMTVLQKLITPTESRWFKKSK